jgi:hypothetical protein
MLDMWGAPSDDFNKDRLLWESLCKNKGGSNVRSMPLANLRTIGLMSPGGAASHPASGSNRDVNWRRSKLLGFWGTATVIGTRREWAALQPLAGGQRWNSNLHQDFTNVFQVRSILASRVVGDPGGPVSEVANYMPKMDPREPLEADLHHTIPCTLDRRLRAKKRRDFQKNVPNPWYGTALPLSCYTNQRPTRAQARTQKSGNSARRSRVRKKPSLILLSPYLMSSGCDRLC